MNLQTRKITLVESVLDVEDENLIIQLEQILMKSKKQRRNLKSMTNEELINRAKRANEDIKNGDVFTEKEAEEIIKKW